MTSFRKMQLALAGAIIGNDLLWLGVPTTVDTLAHLGIIQAASAFLWALGAGAVCLPWAVRRLEPIAWVILGVSAVIAYGIALIGCARFISPIFSGFGEMTHLIEVPLMTWSLAGGLALVAVALLPLSRFPIGLPGRLLEAHEVADQIVPFAPDPAFTAVSYEPGCD